MDSPLSQRPPNRSRFAPPPFLSVSSFLLFQIVISPDVFDDSGVAQFEPGVQIRPQISPTGLPAFGHRAVDENFEVDLADLRVPVVLEIARPRLALDHHEFLEFDGELDEDDRRDETLLVQEGVEVTRKALEFRPVFHAFDEIFVGVVAPAASDADVKVGVEILQVGIVVVVDVLLRLVASLVFF